MVKKRIESIFFKIFSIKTTNIRRKKECVKNICVHFSIHAYIYIYMCVCVCVCVCVCMYVCMYVYTYWIFRPL